MSDEGLPATFIQDTIDRIVDEQRSAIGMIGKVGVHVYESSEGKGIVATLTKHEAYLVDVALGGVEVAEYNANFRKSQAATPGSEQHAD